MQRDTARPDADQDRMKTAEINILVAENRKLLAMLSKAQNVLSEFGQITDESRVGWCMKEIESVLHAENSPTA